MLSSLIFVRKATLENSIITGAIEITEINDLLKENNIPNIDKKARFNPCYVGMKGAIGQINGFFARMHKLCGGTIITASHKEIAAETGYHRKTSQRIVRKLETMGRLIILRGWKNKYIYLPENVGIKSWLENFKAKHGIDLTTQTRVDITINKGTKSPQDDEQTKGQNVPNKGTKCPQDDLSYKESFKESKTASQKIEPKEPQQETEIDRVRNALPKTCLYKIENLNQKIKASIDSNGFEYTLWAAGEAHNGKYKAKYFEDMIGHPEKYDLYEKQRTRKAEAAEIQESNRHKSDINRLSKTIYGSRQSLTQSPSKIDPPFNPQKKTADKERIFDDLRVKFLESIHGDLVNRYQFMTEDQLKSNREFKNFINLIG